MFRASPCNLNAELDCSAANHLNIIWLLSSTFFAVCVQRPLIFSRRFLFFVTTRFGLTCNNKKREKVERILTDVAHRRQKSGMNSQIYAVQQDADITSVLRTAQMYI
jgi:hypothetical protein